MLTYIILIIAGYLIGSINSAIIVCKLMGLPSPRSVGSGNPGTTNVLRLGSKKAAAITLIGDALKGVIPVCVAHALHLDAAQICFVALACVVGHILPIFFGFKGGKGVATSFGAILAINPLLGLAALVTWLVIAGVFRISSLAALIATILTPVYGYFLIGKPALAPLIVLALIVLIRHHQNIKRLLKGEEPRIGKKK